ncbi:hypothetical protein [Oryzomonas rubra]|uniref:Uncharacterized protein n=1 Tax=Oryzomonas rubra TaxID=2509454 RepID=A0A5A9XAM4_9BACT|nr:hypothetical protein [Oryzomonas rubra]KAA0888711.1 hypothetical protein ET418_15130 [Oryzomonas rubra]
MCNQNCHIDVLNGSEIVSLKEITENSIVIIRGTGPNFELSQCLAKQIPPGTLIWMAREGEGIEVLEETEMNRLGWYRK